MSAGPPPATLLTVLLAASGVFAAVVLFGAGLAAIAGHWTTPEYSHGYIIPAVTVFLLWQRWPTIMGRRSAGAWAGTLMVLLGLAMLSASRIALMHGPEAIGFLVVLGGLGLAATGPQAMRAAWLPLAFLLFALPVPTTAYYLLSTELQLISSQIGAAVLRAIGISVFLEGNVIDLGVYKLQVAEACSGLRYLFPLSAFGFLCAWLYRGPLWARVAVFVAVFPITVLTNSLRIALTGVIVEHGSIALAEGFMHLFEGWVIFLLALLLLFLLMRLLSGFTGGAGRWSDLLDFDRMTASAAGGAPASASMAFPRPLLAAMLLLLAWVPVQAAIGTRTELVPQRPGLVTLPLSFDGWQGRQLTLDSATKTVLRTDDEFLGDFGHPDHAAMVNLWVAYYASQIRGGELHSPRNCLPSAGWEFVRIERVAAPIDQGPPFHLNRALAANGQRQVLMYYWYEQRGRRLTDEVWTKIYVLLDAFGMRRSDGALVRLMTPVNPGESLEVAEARLASLLQSAYPALQPHVGL